nr:hypothetical protein [Staphylococcus aureus]
MRASFKRNFYQQRIKNNAFYMLKEYCRLNYNNDEV